MLGGMIPLWLSFVLCVVVSFVSFLAGFMTFARKFNRDHAKMFRYMAETSFKAGVHRNDIKLGTTRIIDQTYDELEGR